MIFDRARDRRQDRISPSAMLAAPGRRRTGRGVCRVLRARIRRRPDRVQRAEADAVRHRFRRIAVQRGQPRGGRFRPLEHGAPVVRPCGTFPGLVSRAPISPEPTCRKQTSGAPFPMERNSTVSPSSPATSLAPSSRAPLRRAQISPTPKPTGRTSPGQTCRRPRGSRWCRSKQPAAAREPLSRSGFPRLQGGAARIETATARPGWFPCRAVKLAPRPGLEPGTCGLTVRRSTD